MNFRYIAVALTTTVFALSAGQSMAADAAASAPKPAASATKAPATSATTSQKSSGAKEKSAKRKASAKIKEVDINAAGKDELMKLPGIGEAEADKIIAARPYGSKSWLMTHNVLSQDKYQAISHLVAAKNAGSYTFKK
jgi:DNA uptake protein ComE-like DNA-binding protein